MITTVYVKIAYLKSVPVLSAAAMDAAYRVPLFSEPLSAQTLPKAYRLSKVFHVQEPQPLKNTVRQSPYHEGLPAPVFHVRKDLR